VAKLSILDLAPIPEGSTPADALHNSLDLARHAEAWDFQRYWVAEHHGVPLFVYNDEPFFGQDRIDSLRWQLEKDGLAKK
jgi:alkanesulfonate monooxygenase SsuD/methylene tetrahydromethanopterin reductase-like flavin-dependent oxidoreductase (luciferase family)